MSAGWSERRDAPPLSATTQVRWRPEQLKASSQADEPSSILEQVDRAVGRASAAAAFRPTAGSAGARTRSRHQSSDWLSPAVVVGLLRVAEALIVLFAAIAAYLTRFHDLDEFGTLELYGGMLALVLTTNILQLAGLYQFNQLTNLFGQSGRLLLAWAAVMLSLLALGFMTKAPLAETSRLWVGLWFVYGFFGLFTARLLLKHQIKRWQAGGRLTRNLVVVGAGEHGQRLIEHLAATATSAERIIGVFDDRHGPGARLRRRATRCWARSTSCWRSRARNPIDQIIVALPWDAENAAAWPG